MNIPKQEEKTEKKVFDFQDSSIWIGNWKFLQSLTGYLSLPVNVLTNNPKISNSNKGDIFQIISPQRD